MYMSGYRFVYLDSQKWCYA